MIEKDIKFDVSVQENTLLGFLEPKLVIAVSASTIIWIESIL